MISIIIPVYNEEENFKKHRLYYQQLACKVEVIVVDGGSVDQSVVLAQKWARVIPASKNRAIQMNEGARAASGDIFLFLHADSLMDLKNLDKVVHVIEEKQWIGGCFKQRLDDTAPIFRWIAWTGNMRAKVLKIFYGDQGIFVRRDSFLDLGGFPEVELGEDVLFTKKLKAKGKVGVLPDVVHCSARRWKKQGILKTFILNAIITFALNFNLPLGALSKQYADVRG